MPAPRTSTGTRSRSRTTAARPADPREAALRQARAREAARRTTSPPAGAPPTGTPTSRTAHRPLTPQEAAALRALLAARGRTTIPAAPRTRRPAPGRRAARRRPAAPAGSRRWPTRLAVGALGLALPVLAGLVVPGSQGTGTAAEPPRSPDLALTAQARMLDDAADYRSMAAELARLRADLDRARQDERAAQERAAAEQATVGAAAAWLYRAPADVRVPLLGLDARTPAATPDVLYRQALAERAERDLEGSVVRAARAVRDAAAASARATALEAEVGGLAARVADLLADVRERATALGPEVAARLAGLATAPTTGEQHARNATALQRWQEQLGVLAAAGIPIPSAAELADPAALPAGLSPALDAGGRAVPGVAWAVAGNRPVTVLPAETVAAVSSALAQVGKPYVPGADGPDAYDCGGFTAASWLPAGYPLPTAAAEQWATGASVPLDQLHPGDLVFADGGADVGLYVGDGQVVRASGASYQVGVTPMADVSGAVRVTLPAPATPNAALRPGTAGRSACGTPPAPAGPVGPAWGGWSNGTIPPAALCPIGRGHALRCDAAAAYTALATAFADAFGRPLCITDSYRPLAAQAVAFRTKPALAAVPGTSNHGWALAVDLCGGINAAGSPESVWMAAHAGRYGWVQPAWARPGGEKPEPWHWEYGDLA